MNNDVVELDLVMMIKKLLLQWKAIIIVGLVFGIVGMNVQYYRAVSAVKLQEQTADTDAESLLTDDEIESVETAVALNKKIADLESYISNSLYMKVDPLDYKELSMVVTIHASAGTDSRDIATLYVSEMMSNEFVEKIIDGVGKDTAVSYVNNLMSVDHQKYQSSIDASIANTDQVNLNMIVPKGWSGDTLSEVMQSTVEDITIANYANQYTATVDYNAVRENSSFEVQTRQKSITDSVSALKNQLATATAEFTDNQNKLYEEKTTIDKDVVSDEDTSAVVIPQRSKKYFAIFVLAGIFFYACVYGGIVVFGKTVYGEYTGSVRTVTTIWLSKQKSGIANILFDDKFIRRLLFKKELDIDSQIRIVAQDVEMLMKGKDNKTLYLLGTERVFSEIKDVLNKELDVVSIKYVSAETSADVMRFVKEIKPEESYITVLEDGITKKDIVSKLVQVSTSGDVCYIGQILVL